jgi:hypothetical protein
MVTEVRQRVTRTLLGRRGTVRDPIWVNRRLLRIGARHQIPGRANAFPGRDGPCRTVCARDADRCDAAVTPGRRRRPGTARQRWMRWKPLGARGTGGGHRREQARPTSGR